MNNTTTKTKQTIDVRKLVFTALLSAMAVVLMKFLAFKIPIMPGFISFDFSDVPNGGPDGGDGGNGGDVIFVVDEGMNTLTNYRHVTKYKAGDGEEGGKKN